MLQSKMFSKTFKEAPKDEESLNAQLLQRAGFIYKEMAGVYSFLPLGLRVLKKIENIIRQEMLTLGAEEILMPALTAESSWQKTGRAEMDILFHLEGRGGAKYVLNPTHEEVITPMAQKFISSFRDLPAGLFQFQNKFRNEPRAKSGILRGREFLMKDLYSFHQDAQDLEAYYEKVKKAYYKIFEKLGLGEQTFLTFASGGAFSKYSHEFQTICSAGEDTIHLCEKCRVAVNEEIIKEQPACPECGSKDLVAKKVAEVGNIFKLGQKFSQAFGLNYKTDTGQEKLVEMGCYGIGLTRAMGVIAELFNDKNGLIWPKSVAPYQAHLLAIGQEKEVLEAATKLYQEMLDNGLEVLYDDRADKTAGQKFAEADLLGIPLRIVVSEKTLAKESVEVKKRGEEAMELVKTKNLQFAGVRPPKNCMQD